MKGWQSHHIPSRLYSTPSFGRLDPDAKLVLVGLYYCCDSYGVAQALPGIVRGECLLLHMSDEQVGSAIALLVRSGFVSTYSWDGEDYLELARYEEDLPSQERKGRPAAQYPDRTGVYRPGARAKASAPPARKRARPASTGRGGAKAIDSQGESAAASHCKDSVLTPSGHCEDNVLTVSGHCEDSVTTVAGTTEAPVAAPSGNALESKEIDQCKDNVLAMSGQCPSNVRTSPSAPSVPSPPSPSSPPTPPLTPTPTPPPTPPSPSLAPIAGAGGQAGADGPAQAPARVYEPAAEQARAPAAPSHLPALVHEPERRGETRLEWPDGTESLALAWLGRHAERAKVPVTPADVHALAIADPDAFAACCLMLASGDSLARLRLRMEQFRNLGEPEQPSQSKLVVVNPPSEEFGPYLEAANRWLHHAAKVCPLQHFEYTQLATVARHFTPEVFSAGVDEHIIGGQQWWTRFPLKGLKNACIIAQNKHADAPRSDAKRKPQNAIAAAPPKLHQPPSSDYAEGWWVQFVRPEGLSDADWHAWPKAKRLVHGVIAGKHPSAGQPVVDHPSLLAKACIRQGVRVEDVMVFVHERQAQTQTKPEAGAQV